MAASNEHSPCQKRSLKGQARTTILEMSVALLHSDDDVDKLIEKLYTLFLEDKNQSTIVCYENFESYHREPYVSINDYSIKFERLLSKLREFQIILPEPVLANHALKSANLSPKSERLIRASITNLTLLDMAQKLKKTSMEIQPRSAFHSHHPFL